MSSVAIAPRTQSRSATVLTEADLLSVFSEADLGEGPLTQAEVLEGCPTGLLIDGSFVAAVGARTLTRRGPGHRPRPRRGRRRLSRRLHGRPRGGRLRPGLLGP